MARAPFYVFARKSNDRQTGKPVIRFCARFNGEDGTVIKTVTLKATTPTKAAVEAHELYERGEAADAADPFVLDLLDTFWRTDSDYAKMKALRGRPLSVRYVEILNCVFKKHLSKPLKGIRLHQLTVSRMEKIILDLCASGVNPRTINNLIQAVRVPVSDRARRLRIPDQLEHLQRVAERPRERGTLSLDEVAKIAALEGESPRIKTAMLLGALCGLRMGEVRGLMPEDRGQGVLAIRHNYVDDREGAKDPKCGSSRRVPLPGVVDELLSLCEALAPKGSRFIIYNEKDITKPIDKNALERGFRRVLKEIGIDEDQRRARNLTFHGLRHTYVSITRAVGLPDFVVQRLAGHKSAVMMERYSHAENVIDFTAARTALEGIVERKTAET